MVRRLRGLLLRAGGLFTKDRTERELAAELESHLRMHIEDNMRRGMTRDEARREALIKLGGIEQAKEAYRDRRGLPWLEHFFHDLRYGLRMLRKSPGFTLVALLTLALGIGANTAIFTVINALVLRPLPYPDPEQLAMLSPQRAMVSVSKAEFAEYRRQSRSYESLAIFSGWAFAITGQGEPEELGGARATASLFSTLGVRPLLGRTFVPEEDQPGHRVAVLSYGLWRRRFGADPSVIGKQLTVDGINDTVVGVMPPDFGFPTRSAQLWLPAPLDPSDKNDYTANYLLMIGRLKPRVSLKQAQDELRTIARRFHQDDPKDYPNGYGNDAAAISLLDHLLGDARRALLVLLAAVGLVLLIACANVAGLLVARSASRGKEIAIRSTLGASRGRVARQLLAESLVLALVGGAAGVVLAYWGMGALIAMLPADTPRLEEINLDGPVLLFSLGITLITGLLFGLAPAFQASRQDVNDALKESGRGVSAASSLHRVHNVLAAAQVGLALVLVVGSGLLIRSFWRLSHVDSGLDTAHLLSLRTSPPDSLYPDNDFERKRAFYHQVFQRIASLPGVESVGAIHLLPFGDSNWNPSLEIEGRPVAQGAALPEVDWRLVTPGYFRTVGTPLLRGRFLTPSDQEKTEPVCVINATLARRFWPGEDALDRRVRTGFDGKTTWVRVVGIVADVKDHGLGAATRPQMYRPYDQRPWATSVTIMVRTSGDPVSLAGAIRSDVWAVDKNVPVSDVQTMDHVVSESVAGPRFHTLLLSVFSAAALVLAAIGIYGVMSYAVAARAHEIGIRMALGARRSEVLRMVLARSLRIAGAGLAAGLLAAFAVTRLMASLLYGVRADDPATFGGVALLLTVVSMLASYLPAWRATRVDPMVALRHE
ncbi:MAG TPA: ABC transporter permease [Terriglobia bacterium]|nr:ABC transporter permease [Terriglobia bacterium]